MKTYEHRVQAPLTTDTMKLLDQHCKADGSPRGKKLVELAMPALKEKPARKKPGIQIRKGDRP